MYIDSAAGQMGFPGMPHMPGAGGMFSALRPGMPGMPRMPGGMASRVRGMSPHGWRGGELEGPADEYVQMMGPEAASEYVQLMAAPPGAPVAAGTSPVAAVVQQNTDGKKAVVAAGVIAAGLVGYLLYQMTRG